MAEKIIKVLILEDIPYDAELNQRNLENSDFKIRSRIVDNKEDFISSLKEFEPNIVLSDYHLPQFNGLEAIKLVQKICPEVPVIIVSGVIGEEKAVSLLKEGAVDFVLKENLKRLPGVVTRALTEAEHIKQHNKAILALKDSEQKYRALVESDQDAIIIMNNDCKIKSWNKGAEKMFGYPFNEVIDKPLLDFIQSDQHNDKWQHISELCRSDDPTKEVKLLAIEGKKKNGSVFPVELTLSVWKSTNGLLVSGIIRDVSHRKLMEEALNLSEQRYRGLFMQAAEAIFLTDMKGKIMDSNSSAEKLYGYDAREFRNININKLFKYKEKQQELINYCSEEVGSTHMVETKHITKSKKEIDVQTSIAKIEIGKKNYLNYICRDTTEENKRKERIIMLSQAFYQSPVSIVVTDVQGKITFVNPKFEQVTGYTENEVIGVNPRILKSGKMDDSVYSELWARITSGKSWNGVLQNKKKDGSLFWENATISGIKNINDDLIGFIAIKEDITWRKEIEQALIESEERYRSLVTMAPDPIIELSLDGYIISANPSFHDLIGRSLKLTLESKFQITNNPYIIPKYFKKVSEKFNQAKKGKVIEPFNIEFINADKHLRSVELNLRLIKRKEKQPIVLAILRDVTERKRANELLLEAIMKTEDHERKRISSEIHDSLQQTLICASLEFQQMANSGLSGDKAFNQGINFLNQAIEESRHIAHTLLPKTVEDNGLIASLMDMVSRLELLSSVKFIMQCDCPDELELDKTISFRIYNIVKEAINNALKHGHPSTIRIVINTIENKLSVRIIDDGIGFDVEKIKTKDSFGISSMQHKINAISGRLNIQSKSGKGTEVAIAVPLVS